MNKWSEKIFFHGEKPDKKKYYFALVLYWIYTLSWVFALIYLYYFTNISIYYKILINLVMILGMPTLSDLFTSYSKFVNENYP